MQSLSCSSRKHQSKLSPWAGKLPLFQGDQHSGRDRHLAITGAKPRKARKEEDPDGIYWHDDQADFERLGVYAEQDARVECLLPEKIGFISETEQIRWQLNQTVNDRAIPIDRELAEGAIKIAKEARN